MASIDSLIPLIYHEKQQAGSMLCAQHALNNLLQGNYFTAPDLSAIAQRLDALEVSFRDDNAGGSSTNMDDTGFFSVQVLEEALQVWGLSLRPWRSEDMRPYQQHPHTQMAFILNQSQHWYTLRRFGRVSPNPAQEADPGEGHWFNLNSFLSSPERVGKLYLGMFLHQAETEGYSIFAVVQSNPDGPLAIPRTEADELAASIPESSMASGSRQGSTGSQHHSEGLEGFEDEDMELQVALQASLMSSVDAFPQVLSSGSAAAIPASFALDPPAASRRPFGFGGVSAPIQVEDDEDEDYTPGTPSAPVDPIAASMARNRAIMERTRREQEAALRDSYEGETTRFQQRSAGPVSRGPAVDEDELFFRALAESEAMARGSGVGTSGRPIEVPDDDDDEEVMEVPPVQPSAPRSALYDRVYDDEDAELQAALRASLEGLPEGFTVPSTPPPVRPQPPPSAPAAPAPQMLAATPSRHEESEYESEAESVVEQAPAEALSLEEIRRRRLARFGG
ncbi:Josephin-domain-containing protein [Obba rivulosa]|uniref:ubiquitinyl hydrolase 1 n=1 Tax=Obba rivulosa TaxID=1052685 RepID=A0A8E2DSQ8_9APHY|nr:Josephin-domain-containing protein [Obba rivulosa]